jgi:hypothetical protein
LKVLKCGAGNCWGKSFGPSMCRMKEYYKQSRRKRTSYIQKVKPKRIGHFLPKNCVVKHVIEGQIERMIEVMGRQTRSKQLLDNLKKTRRYWNLK